MSNTDILEGKWKQLKGNLREHWSRLGEIDIDEINGKRERLVGKIQEKYGLARQEAEEQVSRVLDKVNQRLDS